MFGKLGIRAMGGSRGSGRPFDHGELRFVILGLIAVKPRHGYEIIKAIEDQFGGSYTPSPGVVYPTLAMLEDMGHATVEEANGKKSYTITEQGKLLLAGNAVSAENVLKRMREAGFGPGKGIAPQLIRAMQNLRLAIRLRLRDGPLTEEQLKEIVAALDAAAVTIGRS